MTTRREYLLKQYNDFSSEVLTITKTNIVPSIADYDLVDILYFFNYTFADEECYDTIVRQMMQYNKIQISEDDYKVLYPIFLKYIDIFKNIR